MVRYYPGSKMQAKVYGDDYESPADELLDAADLDEGETFLVNGKSVQLYGIGALAAALNRKSVTIRKWETEGFIPVATYSLPGADHRGRRRLYSKDQINGLRGIASDEGLLYPSANNKWKSVYATDFKRKATDLFKSLQDY
jgi:hypothetical protein